MGNDATSDEQEASPGRCATFYGKVAKMESRLVIRNELGREFLAEFLGTFIMMIFGLCSIAQFVLTRGLYGEFLSINIAWALAVALGVWIAGPVTGGHVNPAVTGAMAFIGKLSVGKMFIYLAAQYLAAFAASACVYGVYHESFDQFDGGVRSFHGPNKTAGIFANYPQKYLTASSLFGDQVLGTMLLMVCVMAMSDEKSKFRVPDGLFPLGVGLIVLAIGLGLAVNCGYPINPARDFAPRLFTAIAGWGPGVFLYYMYWWWIPVLGPHVGAICGVLLYRLLVGLHLPPLPASTPPLPPAASGDLKSRRLSVECVQYDSESAPLQWKQLEQLPTLKENKV